MARYPSTVMVSVVCPWDDAEQLDEGVFRREIRHAVDAGFRRIYVFGTAGEGYAVDSERFRRVDRGLRRRAPRDRGDPDDRRHRVVDGERPRADRGRPRDGLPRVPGVVACLVGPERRRGRDLPDRGLRCLPGRRCSCTTTRRASGGSWTGRPTAASSSEIPNLVATKTMTSRRRCRRGRGPRGARADALPDRADDRHRRPARRGRPARHVRRPRPEEVVGHGRSRATPAATTRRPRSVPGSLA